MIETQFFILTQEQFDQFDTEAQELGLNIDYYLSEFCDVIGDTIWVAN